MTSTKKTLRATFAAIAAATLTMTATPYALAVDGDDTAASDGADTTAAPAFASIPATATLVVHKSTKVPGDAGDGTEKTDFYDAAKAVEGVTFKMYPLLKKVEGEKSKAFDLTKNSEWKAASKYAETFNNLSAAKRDQFIAGGTVTGLEGVEVGDAVESQTTGPNGLATFADKGRGLYVVQEVIPAKNEGVKVGGTALKPTETLGGAKPFIVTLPMTNQKDRTKWLEKVHVYPKNSKSGISKSVDDVKQPGAGNTEGKLDKSTVTYTVRTDVPKGYVQSSDSAGIEAGKQTLKLYQIVDRLSEHVTYQATAADGINIINPDATEVDQRVVTALTEGDDYTVKKAKRDKIISVVFTKTGNDKLVKAAADNPTADLKVEWKLTASIGAVTFGENDGNYVKVPNNAFLIPPNYFDSEKEDGPSPDKPWEPKKPNDPEDPDDPTTPPGPGVEVNSKYGKVTINKTSTTDKTKKLAGAVFKLYTCDAEKVPTDYTKGFAKLDGYDDANKEIPASHPAVFVNNEEDFVTAGEDGQVVIKGLQLNDWNNDSSLKGEKGAVDRTTVANRFYCLFETKAPEGYELLPEPIQFQLLEEGLKYNNEVKSDGAITVADAPKNTGFDLPLTGGKGVLPLIALGGLLVVGAGGYAAVAAKRNRKEA